MNIVKGNIPTKVKAIVDCDANVVGKEWRMLSYVWSGMWSYSYQGKAIGYRQLDGICTRNF